MPELRTAYGVVKPRVEFTDADWHKIESAGMKRLSAQLRKEIGFISQGFVQSYSADLNTIDARLIKKRIKAVIDHAEALMRAFEIKNRFTSVDDWVAMTVEKELMGEDFGKSQVPPIWHALKDVIRAAKAASPVLLAMTVAKRPGRKHTLTKKRFFLQLQQVFEAAGGNATIGTRRVNTAFDIKHETRSAFGDFVHAIYSVLQREKQNELPEIEVSAMGDQIKRALAGAKSAS